MLLWKHFYSWKYPATPSHFKKTPTVQDQIVVLLHALMLSMKVNQNSYLLHDGIFRPVLVWQGISFYPSSLQLMFCLKSNLLTISFNTFGHEN